MSLQAALADLNDAAERIWEAASPAFPALGIEVLPSVGSTNTLLLERGRQGDTAPSLVAAVAQTAGRGRHGRTWEARPGSSLTFSLGLPMRLDAVPGGGSALSLAVGLHVAEALECGLRTLAPGLAGTPPGPEPLIGLKWPNDLWLQGRKLGGILIEASQSPSLSEGERWVVIGVGINLDSPPAPLDATGLRTALPPPCGPMAPEALTPGQAWSWVAPPLLAGVAAFASAGFAPLKARFARRDVLCGQQVMLLRPGSESLQTAPESQGLAKGVSESGALLVHTAQGLDQAWTSGEVSVRLTRPAPAP